MNTEPNKKNSKKNIIIRSAISLLIIALIIVGAYFLYKYLGWDKFSKEQLQKYIQEKGVWAPLVYIAVSFLQVTFIPIPASITIIAGNYLFGTWRAFVYSYIGIMIGSLFAFLLGRLLGKPFVNWIAGDKTTVDNLLKETKDKEVVILFFMFLLPFFPDDLLCSVAGILPISWKGFTFMQLITRATSIGATLLFMSGEFIPYTGWGLYVLITLGVLSIVAFILSMKYSTQINDFVRKMAFKISPNKKKALIKDDKSHENHNDKDVK